MAPPIQIHTLIPAKLLSVINNAVQERAQFYSNLQEEAIIENAQAPAVMCIVVLIVTSLLGSMVFPVQEAPPLGSIGVDPR